MELHQLQEQIARCGFNPPRSGRYVLGQTPAPAALAPPPASGYGNHGDDLGELERTPASVRALLSEILAEFSQRGEMVERLTRELADRCGDPHSSHRHHHLTYFFTPCPVDTAAIVNSFGWHNAEISLFFLFFCCCCLGSNSQDQSRLPPRSPCRRIHLHSSPPLPRQFFIPGTAEGRSYFSWKGLDTARWRKD